MYLVFDIGGTKMRVAFSSNGKSFDAVEQAKTPQKFSEAVLIFKSLADKVSGGKKIKFAAGGIAGPINKDKDSLVNAPNLPDWNGKNIKSYFEKVLKCPVRLENDATMGALGEAIYGAGKDKKIVAFLTISTGIGGARIVDGKIDVSSRGFEPGHIIIDPKYALCDNCPTPPYLENMCSGKSLTQRFGKDPKDIDMPHIWEDLALWLAYGLNNIAVLWSPDVIVLGGPMMFGSPAIPITLIDTNYKDIVKIFSNPPEIRLCELKDDAGLRGALHYLKDF